MEVRCDRCKSQYTIDDARVTEAGVTVRCTQCQHTFIVKKKAWVVTVPVKPGEEVGPSIDLGAEPPPATPEPPATPPAAKPPAREWRVRQASGNTFTFRELTSLQRWIVERKIARDDEISMDGQKWKRLGDIAELAGFFLLVDEAQRAAELQVQARLGLIPGPGTQGPSVPVQPGTPEAPAPTPPVPASMAMPPRAEPSEPPKRGNRWVLPVAVLALLGVAGAGAYFLVLLPRERAAQAERQEAARREQEQLAKAGTPGAGNTSSNAGTPTSGTAGTVPPTVGAVPPALTDAGTPSDGGETPGMAGAADAGGTVAQATPDGGAADAGAALDAGLAGDAGTSLDAGTFLDAGTTAADAGTLVADAGTSPDAGMAAPKRPEPVHDFDYYMTQGDNLREREKADPALNAYDKAVELEPDRAEPYAGRGLVHLDLGDYSLAEGEFKRALKRNPRYAVALMGLAETYRSQGKKAEAVRYYERYLEVLPNGPEAPVARSALERLRE